MIFSNIRNLNRFQATLGHFVFSIALLVAIVTFLHFVWFPNGLFLYGGGIDGLKILAPVDLVLGPLLTLVIFNPKKKSLPLDLMVIFAIQVSALAWGLAQVEKVRPHYLVAFLDTIYVVEKADLDNYIETVKIDVGPDILPSYTPLLSKPKFVTLNNETEEIKKKREYKLAFAFLSGEGPWLDYFDYIQFDQNKHETPSIGKTRNGELNIKLDEFAYPMFSKTAQKEEGDLKTPIEK